MTDWHHRSGLIRAVQGLFGPIGAYSIPNEIHLRAVQHPSSQAAPSHDSGNWAAEAMPYVMLDEVTTDEDRDKLLKVLGWIDEKLTAASKST